MKKIIRFLGKTIVPIVAVVVLFSCVSLGYARKGLDEDISLEGAKIRSYTLNLKQLVKEAEKNIKKVEGEIEEREIENCNRQREDEIRKHFERGNTLYKEGKLEEAKIEWQKALKISKDPEIRDYIRGSEKRAKQEELERRKKLKKKEERKRQKELGAEKKEKERRKKLAREEAEAKKKIAPLLSEARSLYKKKEYTKSEAKYRDVLKLDKENKTALRYLAIIPKKIKESKWGD